MKILIAEDDTGTRLVLAATLKKLGHEVRAVADGMKAWEAWQREDFKLVISDWLMPGIDGIELCRRIRGVQRLHYTYIVLLTSLDGKARYIDGIDAGADDLITKPFDEDLLDARLRVAERILALHDALREQATHDRLTGLWNRGAILDNLQQEIECSARDGSHVGVMLVDLDYFKRVNDNHGHAVGDQVLEEAARRMKAGLRSYDLIGRYGGEEFLVVVRSASRECSRVVAQRLCSGISATPIQSAVGPIGMTVSVGVAISGEDGERADAAKLIAAADGVLYLAKRAGRNRVEMAGPAPSSMPDLLPGRSRA